MEILVLAFAKLSVPWWQLQVGVQTGILIFWQPICSPLATERDNSHLTAEILLPSPGGCQQPGEHTEHTQGMHSLQHWAQTQPNVGCNPWDHSQEPVGSQWGEAKGGIPAWRLLSL